MKKLSLLTGILALAALATAPARAAELSGSLTIGPQYNINLTTLGTEDWAIWGYANGGTSISLSPDVSLNGGTAISDLTWLKSTTSPYDLRGIGQFHVNYSFDWTNGDTVTSANSAYAGLQVYNSDSRGGCVGDGFSFTVPASLTLRVLTIFVDLHLGTGTLTATLTGSGGKVYSTYTDSSVPTGVSNSAGFYTITYASDSNDPDQELTVTWQETAASGSYDNPAIYAVALTQVTAVPEPGSLALLALGAAGVICWFGRKSSPTA